MKLQACLFAAALSESQESRRRGRESLRGRERGNVGGRNWYKTSFGQTPLGPNQCAYCKQEGHWKNECPHLRKTQGNTKELIVMVEIGLD